MRKQASDTRSIRLPDGLWRSAGEAARRLGTTRTKLIEHALRQAVAATLNSKQQESGPADSSDRAT